MQQRERLSQIRPTRAQVSGSFPGRLFRRLRDLNFTNEATLFGAGLLVSLLPFMLVLSVLVSERVEDDLALHLGLSRHAARIVSELFRRRTSSLGWSTALGALVVALGTVAVVSSLQEIYEKAFGLERRGIRDVWRFVVWILAMCGFMSFGGIVGRPLRNLPGGIVAVEVVGFAVVVPFMWWTMHFLLAGRLPWRTLLPSALATGVLAAMLGLGSKLYFSSSIVTDARLYGSIGAVFSLMTWLIGIGAVIIIGAVAGPVWQEGRLARPITESTGREKNENRVP